jgi:hypothetical protein
LIDLINTSQVCHAADHLAGPSWIGHDCAVRNEYLHIIRNSNKRKYLGKLYLLLFKFCTRLLRQWYFVVFCFYHQFLWQHYTFFWSRGDNPIRLFNYIMIDSYSNITSFFRIVNKLAIYRLGIISLAHAPVNDFCVVNVHVDELLSARIWQHILCATLSVNVNINCHLVLSFNMGWRILVLVFYPEPDARDKIY